MQNGSQVLSGSLDKALSAATRSFAQWGGFAPGLRVAVLRGLSEELAARRCELVATAATETGLGGQRLAGEVERTRLQLAQFARFIEDGGHFDAVIDPATDARPDVRRVNVPLGPVAVFAASNFPFAFGVAGTDTAAALAAGCPVIVKGHPSQPETARLVAAAVHAALTAAGAPAGAFQLLPESGLDTGRALVRAPEITAVAFTGSLTGGRALFDLAAARPRPIPVYAEMGSLNPVFLLPGAVMDAPEDLADAYVESLTASNGQLCTKPGVTFLPQGEPGDRFVARAVRQVEKREPDAVLNGSIWQRLVTGTAELADRPGVTVLAGCSAPDGAGRRFPVSLVQAALDTFLTDPALTEERFGPFGVIVRYDTQRALTAVASLDGHLTATIHLGTGDEDDARRLAADLTGKVGRLVWNGWPTGVAVTDAMHHGGPYPASTSAAHTSVGTHAIARFLRPVAFQNSPQSQLPAPLQDANPMGIPRRVAGRTTAEAIGPTTTNTEGRARK
ncbi:aldehyde dehydrogenase (NADP(+)) [Streptomyces fuscichromogenes]|uniref:2,5-dioxovalerate dehydrogenase n=1 Tax=Streptomyces fuscichromogenes TaxID=1324013 RepID=A0A917XQY7_9ACTN|nr:aldehyde dehydrogenase (NADP(+)) [Streptomyces fuscichromogenes]GGN47207.1 2,5-dioxovalerate dehydrogenase [Streptomyces fuscichromogenes]